MTDQAGTALRELAARVGILPEYVDQTGTETRATSDDTRRALLAAMGIDASSDAAAAASLATLRGERTPPVRVVAVTEPVTLNETVEIETEDGQRRSVDAGVLPTLPLGYHTLRFAKGEQSLIVVPPRCVAPDRFLGEHKAFGLTANLYTIRSATNWGVGDFSDLSALAAWTGSIGGDFVGVNPLHALLNRGDDVSPYSPVSRLFRNPIYIDVGRIPEIEHAPEVRDRLSSPEFAAELDALRESARVRYDQVTAVKGLAFDALHKIFAERVRQGGCERARAYETFVAEREPSLGRFATWMAIAEREGTNWRAWPAELRDADSSAVKRFAAEHAVRVDFHRWLQFEAERQLADAAGAARSAGMRIGLYQDLAVGSSPAGADTWAFPDLFARGVSVGAPPDPYAANGQNWGLPPIDPWALQRSGYRYFIDLLRQGFRHAGALRIDHVLGFFRLFWIPDGWGGDRGAYVRYPTDDLFGILALESARNDALVVGEDLGTIPPEVAPTLETWGVLSSKVMFFEREHDGRFKAAESYPTLALATADTHDMAPIAGFWSGRDVELRREVGLIDDAEAEQARAQRDDDRSALLDRLFLEKVLTHSAPRSPVELRSAVHAFVCRTPSRLVGLALDDLAGETEPVNVPGVGQAQFKSWTRKMTHPLELIAASADTAAVARCDGRRTARLPKA